MAEVSQIPAWVALFAGLYALGASIGELRVPGSWVAMLDDFENRSGLQFLTGIVLIGLGAAIYLANPWNPSDWLAVVVTVLGGGMALEGVIMLGFGKPYMHFARKLLGQASRGWAILSAILGIALIAVALMRL